MRSATVPFVRNLATHGDRVAMVTGDGQLSYRQLACRVDKVAAQLGAMRRLVLIAGSNDMDSVVAYLAALSGGHVALLVPPGQAGAVTAAYDPDVIVRRVDGTAVVDVRREVSGHELHPDLALLLSTSGSTGSPKLVRLSQQNVQANAESIARYLGIVDSDRAATTLPMHYCYGLSVINSHLLRGAGLILTDLSVVDGCFWDLFRRHRGTSFAGVPHTFDLLDRVGFADMDLPHLRYVTQAGGRLAPERVRRYAELGHRNGWDLFVMYGQTEATARMAYLPPKLAVSHPHTIGIPIPGGSFTIDPLPHQDNRGVGELVYTGPNVMLGYAQTAADLRLGRTVTALRTGDLARRSNDGLYEIVGRRTRFVKIFGLRIDLQHLETVLAERGLTTCCTGRDGELRIAVEGDHNLDQVRHQAAQQCGLPVRAIQVAPVAELPRLASGKPDYRAVAELPASPAAAPGPVATPTMAAASITSAAQLRDLFAEILNRPDATEDSTFVGLGGDSLSYVEMSAQLEKALGHLPANWHLTPIKELSQPPRHRRRLGGHAIETSVLIRAAAILLIVGTHSELFAIPGGAHLLLAVAGFNFARFQLAPVDRLQRLRHQLAGIARIAIPSMLWIAAVVVLTDQYGLINIVLLNGLLGPPTWAPGWDFWFVEILVYILLTLAALMAIPRIDRIERRFPFGFVAVLLSLGLLTRFQVVDLAVPHMKPAFWLFALGWAIARACTTGQRLVLTAVIVATVPGFFDNLPREAVMIGGMALLLWTTHLVCPAPVSRIASVLASSSLYIYLTHWQIYPHLADNHQVVAILASLAVGVAAWMITTQAIRRLAPAARHLRRHRQIKHSVRRSPGPAPSGCEAQHPPAGHHASADQRAPGRQADHAQLHAPGRPTTVH